MIVTAILFYLVWNSSIHQNHPTLVPVLLTLWVVGLSLKLIKYINEEL
jgi:hypothetical protein